MCACVGIKQMYRLFICPLGVRMYTKGVGGQGDRCVCASGCMSAYVCCVFLHFSSAYMCDNECVSVCVYCSRLLMCVTLLQSAAEVVASPQREEQGMNTAGSIPSGVNCVTAVLQRQQRAISGSAELLLVNM